MSETKPSKAKSATRQPVPPSPPSASPFVVDQLRQRVAGLRAELHDLDSAYQSQCADVRELYAVLDDIRDALVKEPPDVATALALLAAELDDQP
jgi:hypothetical protein